MDGAQMQKGMIQLLKSNLQAYFQTQAMLQEQGEKMLEMMLAQCDAVQAEGRNLLKQALESAKQASAEYRKMLEQGLKQSEDFFGKQP